MTPPTLSRLIALALGATASAMAPAPGRAAPVGARVFRLPSEPVEQALIRFALQAEVSVGWSGPAACRGMSRPVQGALAPAEALARLLPPGCAFVAPDAWTFRIVARKRQGEVRSAPPPPPPEPS